MYLMSVRLIILRSQVQVIASYILRNINFPKNLQKSISTSTIYALSKCMIVPTQ